MQTRCPPQREHARPSPSPWRQPDTCPVGGPAGLAFDGQTGGDADLDARCPTLDAVAPAGGAQKWRNDPDLAQEWFGEPSWAAELGLLAPLPEEPPHVQAQAARGGEEPGGLAGGAPAGGPGISPRRSSPGLAKGHISRDAAGNPWGVGGRIGLDHTEGGTTVSGLTTGHEIGFGGDRGLYGHRASSTMGGVSHDPAKGGQSGFWGGGRVFDGGTDAIVDAQHGVADLSFRADILSGEVGARSVDYHSGSDRGLRIGASAGMRNGGFRGYYQDADNDLRPEYGLGLSAPSFGLGMSIDYTTETPIGDLVSLACPISIPIQAAMVAYGAEEQTPAVQIQRAAERLWNPQPAASPSPLVPPPSAAGPQEP